MNQSIPCRDCMIASWLLRRIGFRDTIGWGMLGGPTQTAHASHSNTKGMPLCTTYRSELAWMTAGRPTRLVVYMAHPVTGDFDRNVANALAWFRYLRTLSAPSLSELTRVYYEQKPLIIAPWLVAIDPEGDELDKREQTIADCKDLVLLADEVWYFNRISDGMQAEGGNAKIIRDMTFLGESPPIPIIFAPKKPTRKSK